MPTDLRDYQLNIGWGDGKTIIWTYVDPDLWNHMASQGHNELTLKWLPHVFFQLDF